jgi:hypothetical protein
MRTNATIIQITRSPGGAIEPRSIRCLFIGSSLVEQGAAAVKLAGTLLVSHHELVRDAPAPPHGYPRVGDTVVIRPDAVAGEFGDATGYVIDSARAHPGGALKHWHYTLK